MATIKSFTDIEQSKKLAEILPLESADMMYHSVENEYGSGAFVATSKGITNGFENDDFYIDDIPCWSLAALLGILPILDNRSPVISKTFDGKYRVVYHSTAYEKAILTSDYDNPVDACVTMIEKLKELNLL